MDSTTAAARGVVHADNVGRWHATRQCPALRAGERAGRVRIVASAETVVALAAGRRRSGAAPTPCYECALPVVLDGVSTRVAGPGWYALTCALIHAHTRCTLCAALTRYARGRQAPAAGRGGQVSILAPGAVRGPFWPFTGLEVMWESTDQGDLPAITTGIWTAAAGLLTGPDVTLDQALRAACGLHTSPAGPACS